VERSGPEDARDDAPDDPWDDDAPTYPAAPLPVHERTWRHPSEMGHAAWGAAMMRLAPADQSARGAHLHHDGVALDGPPDAQPHLACVGNPERERIGLDFDDLHAGARVG